MVKGYIYRHWIINDKGIEKSYVGQTINELEVRWQNGLGYTSGNTKFSRAIKKYGWNNFHHDVIKTVECETKEELKKVLNLLEEEYIETYDSFYNGYNMTTGGDSRMLDEETRNKITDAVRKDVICLNTGEVFHGIVLAYQWATGHYDNKDVSSICKCCKGEKECAYKHPETGEKLVWRYKEDYDKMTKEEIETLLNEVNPQRENLVFYSSLDENVSYNEEMFKKTLEEKLQPVLKMLSPRQELVFIEHFVNGKVLREIAEENNITTTRVGNLAKQVEKKIKEQYTYEELANLLK